MSPIKRGHWSTHSTHKPAPHPLPSFLRFSGLTVASVLVSPTPPSNVKHSSILSGCNLSDTTKGHIQRQAHLFRKCDLYPDSSFQNHPFPPPSPTHLPLQLTLPIMRPGPVCRLWQTWKCPLPFRIVAQLLYTEFFLLH